MIFARAFSAIASEPHRHADPRSEGQEYGVGLVFGQHER